MRKLCIHIGAIVASEIPGSVENLQFVKDTIHNLYRINQQLNYKLFFLVKDPAALLSKALNILERESIQFELLTDLPQDDENIFVINRRENNFEITGNNVTIDVDNWNEVFNYLQSSSRKIAHTRNTNETKIGIELNLDGSGKYDISTGLGFFDHMLEQFSKHSNIDLTLRVLGDLHIDEHHTIEDTAITLGEAVSKALGDKRGMERYGFLLPMDDCLAQAAIDFGGRSWLVWDVVFKREHIGDVPTEMFFHFFKSFCDAARCNLNIKAEGTNEHHKIESIFKAFAKAVKMAVAVNYDSVTLPTTKGIL